jgi:hypothetical protein
MAEAPTHILNADFLHLRSTSRYRLPDGVLIFNSIFVPSPYVLSLAAPLY